MPTFSSAQGLFNRLRYKHLLMLVTLSTHQNLHRAAEALNMSQPATTRMLQEIEDAFGCELFERLPRGMRATALGEELIRFARTALTNLDRCAEDIAERLQGGYGHLTIGTIMGATPDLVGPAIAEIKRRRPELRIRIMGDTSDQLIRLLDEGDIDIAIGRNVTGRDCERFEFQPLANERLVIAVRTGHPLCGKKKLKLADLVEAHSWLLQPPTSPARIALEGAFENLSLPSPRDVIECTSVFAMLQLVQHTDALMVLSENVLVDHLKMGLVQTLPLDLDEQIAPFGVLRRRGEVMSGEQREFLEVLGAQ